MGVNHRSKHKSQKAYTCLVYTDQDIYEHTLRAARVCVTGESIQFYDVKELIIAIFPARSTVVIDNEYVTKG